MNNIMNKMQKMFDQNRSIQNSSNVREFQNESNVEIKITVFSIVFRFSFKKFDFFNIKYKNKTIVEFISLKNIYEKNNISRYSRFYISNNFFFTFTITISFAMNLINAYKNQCLHDIIHCCFFFKKTCFYNRF